MKRRYVIVDRDGTLNVERHYLSDPEGLELLPGVVEGLRYLRDLGLGLIVVTNQSGVGRGYSVESDRGDGGDRETDVRGRRRRRNSVKGEKDHGRTEDVLDRIKGYLRGSAEVQKSAADRCAGEIRQAAELIVASVRDGGKILLCGNGGSAADCQHMAAELVGRLTRDFARPGIAAVALTTNTSFLTAHPNDFDFQSVFERQVLTLGRRGDVLVGISTGGESANVVQAVHAARKLGLKVVTLTGEGGILGALSDVAIRAPSASTQYIQEAHLAIEHILCHLIERQLFAGGGTID